MDLTVPKTATELILYIWKIVDLPKISIEKLIYEISFKLFLFAPKKAALLINRSIENNLLAVDNENNLYLSKKLDKQLNEWQIEKKKSIKKKIKTRKQKELAISKDIINSNDIITLLDAFADKQTKNRAVAVSSAQIKELNKKNAIIRAEISGSKGEKYLITIDKTKLQLEHDCHDFKTRRAQNKRFCKHLVKFFLDLKEKDEQFTIALLGHIAEKINEWTFSQ